MLLLKKVKKDGSTMSFVLGDDYGVVLKSITPDEFKKIQDSDEYYQQDIVYGFVTCSNRPKIFPLFNTQRNYIVSDRGNTVEHIKE